MKNKANAMNVPFNDLRTSLYTPLRSDMIVTKAAEIVWISRQEVNQIYESLINNLKNNLIP